MALLLHLKVFVVDHNDSTEIVDVNLDVVENIKPEDVDSILDSLWKTDDSSKDKHTQLIQRFSRRLRYCLFSCICMHFF